MLLDGVGGPADVLAVLSRQYRLLSAANRPDEAAQAEQRVRRLCAELGIADPGAYLDPLPQHRRLADLQAAAAKWRQQGNRKFLAFALAEVAQTLAAADFPVAAVPVLTEAKRLADRLPDRAFNHELKTLHEVVHEGAARQRPEMVELARPRRVLAILSAVGFGGLAALVLWSIFLLLGELFRGAAGERAGLAAEPPAVLVAGLAVPRRSVLRQLHGLLKPPSLQAGSPGILLRGWGLEGPVAEATSSDFSGPIGESRFGRSSGKPCGGWRKEGGRASSSGPRSQCACKTK